MHLLRRRASYIFHARQNARLHFCVPCALQLSRRAFAASATQRADDDGINYFEETTKGKFRRVNKHAEEESLNDLKARIAQLEQEVRALESSGDPEQQLGQDDPEVRKRIEQFRRLFGEDIDLDGDPLSPGNSKASSGLSVNFPKRQRIHLESFNRVLREVAKDVTKAERNSLLWAKYTRCKQRLPDFLEEMSAKVWDVLWQSQYTGNPEIASRTKRLWQLVQDMSRVRRKLTPVQKLVRIEALSSRGDNEAAMALWRDEWNQLSKDDPVRSDYRDLGIRLHADLGQLNEAREVALDTVQLQGKPKAEDVAILITSWAQKGDEKSLKMAWSLYLDLRTRLGSQMSLDNYDDIVMAFLGAARSSLALAVFKDLVLSGKESDWDSMALVKRSSGLYRQLHEHSSGLADLTQISLAALSFIPPQLENKYFFASWIKRLIGMGEVDSAVPVLALMYERGIRPDAIHLNGMVSAWLRNDDKQKHDLALQIGWSMVKERLKLVAERHALDSGRQLQVELPDLGVLVPPYVSKNLPPATIETFSILLLYYEGRSMQTSMDIVQRMLQLAEMKPNSFFMNHLLHAELRNGHVKEAWKKFQSMRQTIAPDLATFGVLWECAKLFTSMAGRNISGREGFPTPRVILSNMMEWLSSLRPEPKAIMRKEFSQEHFNLIIRCFCFRQDMVGTIIALYALRDAFGRFPDEDTVRLITIQLSRKGENVPVPKRRRVRLYANKDSIGNMAKVSEIFKVVSQERSASLKDMGISEEELPVQAQGEEVLYKVTEVLRAFLKHLRGVEAIDTPTESLEKVAFEMGVGGLNMEAPVYPLTKSPAVAEQP